MLTGRLTSYDKHCDNVSSSTTLERMVYVGRLYIGNSNTPCFVPLKLFYVTHKSKHSEFSVTHYYCGLHFFADLSLLSLWRQQP
jgi:hypothetical protein